MELIRITNGQLAFGTHPLLDNADLQINRGERVCIVGRNGEGKSSLLKVLSSDQILDDGTLQFVNNIRVARLEQDPPRGIQGSVYNYVAQELSGISQLIERFNQLSDQAASDPTVLPLMHDIQQQIDQCHGWTLETRINQTLSILGLNADDQVQQLSGGWLRKVALAKALVTQPDVLLLDEPTNHLDIEAVSWLEGFLKGFAGAIVFISHDRAFIRNLATRIVDLDRGKVTSFDVGYDQYLLDKQKLLEVEEQQNALFDKKLAQEEVWIRQGIKARRTRNEGRVRALKALRNERQGRIEQPKQAKMQINQGQKSAKKVFELSDVSYSIDNKNLIEHFSALVMRGERIALVGPNGIGKSTLIKLMLGAITPNSGKVVMGENLLPAYFDQHRMVLNLEQSVQDNVADGKQEIITEQGSRHVLGYLQDFLFPPSRARSPVKALSGGEKNRLLLAKLFVKPSNLLILDEPTNDLDIETLELLEDLVADYQGSVLLVSHDREFINNTATSIWVFEGNGKINQIVGGFDDYQHYLANKKTVDTSTPIAPSKQSAATKASDSKKKKLSYHEVRELESLPKLIEQLENDIAAKQELVNEPDFFKQSDDYTALHLNQLAELESKLDIAFERWESLEQKQQENN